MRTVRKAKIIKKAVTERLSKVYEKRMPVITGPVLSVFGSAKETRTVVWLKGGSLKQVEYCFVGLRKEVIFKLKEIDINQVQKIVNAMGIKWVPVKQDLDADYIKFMPREGDTQ